MLWDTIYRNITNSNPISIEPKLNQILFFIQLQFYDENAHLLRKGVKGGKASTFVDAAFGFVALRYGPENIVLSQQDNTLSSELIQHRTSVVQRRLQFASFAKSLFAGNVGRFEAVFDYVGLDPNLIGQAIKPDLNTRFRTLLLLALQLQIIAVSTGNWWKKLNLNPFIKNTLNPFLTIAYQSSVPTLQITSLRRIYDLEIVVYYWSLGRAKNKRVDTHRLKFLISDDDKASSQLPFHRPQFQNQLGPSDPTWFDKNLIKRHGYVDTVGNHITFLLNAKHAPVCTGNLTTIFSSIITFYALYCANSWHLEQLLVKNKTYRVLDCFAIETVQRQRTANRYKRDKPRSISFNSQQLSYLTVFENMLWPNSLIGQIILNIHVSDDRTLQALRHQHDVRGQCLQLVRQNVHCFPAYLTNDMLPTDLALKTAHWYSWCTVSKITHSDANIASNGLMMGRDCRFHPYKRTAALSTPTGQSPVIKKNVSKLIN